VCQETQHNQCVWLLAFDLVFTEGGGRRTAPECRVGPRRAVLASPAHRLCAELAASGGGRQRRVVCGRRKQWRGVGWWCGVWCGVCRSHGGPL